MSMVLQTLGKLATKAMKVANNKAENLLNKGIEKLDAMDNGTAPGGAAATKRARVKVAITANVSNNTDLTVLLTKDSRTERITFRKGGNAHEAVMKIILEAIKETGAL